MGKDPVGMPSPVRALTSMVPIPHLLDPGESDDQEVFLKNSEFIHNVSLCPRENLDSLMPQEKGMCQALIA